MILSLYNVTSCDIKFVNKFWYISSNQIVASWSTIEGLKRVCDVDKIGLIKWPIKGLLLLIFFGVVMYNQLMFL